jgi:preprotein translocase SecE subunit
VADENSSSNEAARSKRRLRPATSSETLRERSEKLQSKATSPKKPSKVRAFFAGFFAPLRWVGRQLAKLGRFRVVRWLGYLLFVPYIRNSWRELRLVTWPNRHQTFGLVWAVIIFSVVFGVLIATVDFGLDKLFKEFIVK